MKLPSCILLLILLGQFQLSIPSKADQLTPNQATQLLQKAADAASAGDAVGAEKIWQQLLPWVRKQASPDSAILPGSLLQLAKNQQNLGQFTKADASYEEALLLSRSLQPPRPKLVAALLNDRADLNSELGRLAEAKKLLEESIAIKLIHLGETHQEVGIGYSNLGDLSREMGDLNASEYYLKKSLAVLMPAVNEHPLPVAATLNNLSRLQQERGQWQQAEQTLIKAQKLRSMVLRVPHPDLILGLNNLGMLALSRYDFANSKTYLNKAYEQAADSRNGQNSKIAIQEANLARLASETGQLSSALIGFKKAQLLFDKKLGVTHPDSLNNLADLLLVQHQVKGSNSIIKQLTQLLENRFALLTNQAWQLKPKERLLLLNKRDHSWYLADALAEFHPEAAQLALSLRLSIQGLLQEIQREQKQLLDTESVSELNNIPASNRWINSAQVASALPANGILVELRRYLDPALIPHDPKVALPWQYRAYVLRPNGNLKIVEYGASENLDKLIRSAYIATKEELTDAPKLWHAVSKSLLDPLRFLAPDADEWFIVPDAGLHQVPYQSLAPDRNIRLLTAGRDLIRLNKKNTSADVTKSVVAGNPQIINNLPATSAELNGVAKLLDVKPTVGPSFTSNELRKLSSPRILHLATHGFWDSGNKINVRNYNSTTTKDPMLRSGILLSPSENIEDGKPDRFTAADFLGLKLNGTELVTLSACSTGLGDLHDSEGIYGLQRGVQVAGARSVLTSLWPVDDDATSDWMLRYYRHLKLGSSRSDALKAVQNEFRNHPKQIWQQPYYWAGWQLVGDWKPIQGI